MPIWKRDETIQNGRFLIKKRLGEGGFGITYLAEEPATGKQVVIKTLNANRQNAENFKQIQVSFMNEALKQYQEHGHFAAYTDVYALAATTYNLLTGHRPIPANIRQSFNVDLPEPKQSNPAISDQVNHAIMQGLSIDHNQRPQNMTEFRELLGLVTKSANQEPILDTEAYFNRGVVKYDLGDKQGALADFNKAIELDPNLTTAYNNRGNFKYESGDNQGALADCNKAIELDPNLTTAYNNRGNVKSKLGDNQGALADFNKAIKLDSNRTYAYANRGNVKYELGDKQGALADFNKAIELDPNFARAYNNHGNFKYELGDQQGALADYNKAIELDPNFTCVYFNRGIVKSELGDNQGALADYNKAAQLYQEEGQAEEYERTLRIIKNLKDSIEMSGKPKNSDRPWWRMGI
jgi:tetratricopeptide (TPR) repeat protein